MLYEVRGYIFDKESKPLEIKRGITVASYEAAKQMFEQAGCTQYLFTLIPVKEGE